MVVAKPKLVGVRLMCSILSYGLHTIGNSEMDMYDDALFGDLAWFWMNNF